MAQKKTKREQKEFQRDVARQIQRLADPKLDQEALWVEISTDLGSTKRKLGNIEAETAFYELDDNSKEEIRLATLIIRAALLLAMKTRRSPTMVLGSLAGATMEAEIDGIMEIQQRQARDN